MSQSQFYYKQVALLHYNGIDQGFLATLGDDFLAILYEAIDGSDGAVLITEVKDGRVVGFVAGAKTLKPIYLQMLRRLPRLLMALAHLVLRPVKLWRVLELIARRRFGALSVDRAVNCCIPEFELLSISVAVTERRSGVAKRLYQGLVQYARDEGIEAFKIVVGERLAAAHKFYLRMGAVAVAKTCVHGAEESIVYAQRVDQSLLSDVGF